jgi:ATP-dependent DNA helicase RecQ
MDERLEEFLERCLLLDLETGPAGAIHKIGAVWREETFLRQGRFELKVALAELDGFATDADFLLGHNLLGQVFGWGREMVQTGLAEKRTTREQEACRQS